MYNHSFGSCKYEGSSLLQHCEKFQMNLCLYDSRGSGESSKSFISFGYKEKVDLLYVILKLNFEYSCLNFILYGRSIGCNTIL